jgi:D-alanyl-lipoteichoic acid acyltransferase DltB (MBOAT superfamily)
MIFNSFEFAIFLPAVFLLYWFVFKKNLTVQNFFIIIVSYFFYGWWDWRFLSLLFISTLADFYLGWMIKKSSNKKMMLGISLAFNLGLLGFFKYYNFFTESFISAFSSIGINLESSTLNIILPVGISFYTFQSLSYTIDIYRGRLEPVKDPIQYFAFVAFFPQLVAGPIERASNLLPQFEKERTFNYQQAIDGLRQMLWGFFKKVVIADNCAYLVNEAFSNYESLSGSTLALGAIYFAFQIYCDFSGYSDIAIGCAKLFGFNLMQNFSYPYFSRDIPEFWRRWHISLSTWFKDYLFIPLGGSRGSTWQHVRNILIVFIISGFWHGANWTFVIWGALNGLYFIPWILAGSHKKNSDIVAEGKLLPSMKELLQMSITFTLITISWIFFRASSTTQAWNYLKNIFSPSLLTIPTNYSTLLLLALFVLVEWISRTKLHALEIKKYPAAFRWGIYYSLVIIILYLGEFGHNDFIYFQF